MTPRSLLYQWFKAKAEPTAAQFAEVFDSFFHKGDDSIGIAMVAGLSNALALKASTASLKALENIIALIPIFCGVFDELDALKAEYPIVPNGSTATIEDGETIILYLFRNNEWVTVSGGGNSTPQPEPNNGFPYSLPQSF